MKQLKIFLFYNFLFIVLVACKKEDKEPISSGLFAQKFYCKINGEDFYPVGFPFGCDAVRFDYYPEAFMNIPPGYLIIRGRDCTIYESVGFRLFDVDTSTSKIIFKSTEDKEISSPFYSVLDTISGVQINYEKLINGEVNISRFIPREDSNSPDGVIEGTFQFTVTHPTLNDTIRVTEGYFKLAVPDIF